MKLQVASDLHLEFYSEELKKVDFLYELLDHTETDEIIIAGDIGYSEDYFLLDGILRELEKTAYVVTGNHEYYGCFINDPKIDFDYCFNIIRLNNSSSPLSTREVITGGTLWTNLPADYDPALYVNDIKRIIGLNSEVWQGLHTSSLEFLQKSIPIPDVVVTHHAPSFRSIPERFKGSPANNCFASDLEFLMRLPLKLWVHGHTHDSFDYMINDVRVVCNPFGYYNIEENPDFDFRKIIEW